VSAPTILHDAQVPDIKVAKLAGVVGAVILDFRRQARLIHRQDKTNPMG
jgi:hypothetical protein